MYEFFKELFLIFSLIYWYCIKKSKSYKTDSVTCYNSYILIDLSFNSASVIFYINY